MQRKPLEPKGKLGAMTGYSWSTPAVDMGAVTVNGPEGQARDHDLAGWDAIDWRACEGEGRRVGGRGVSRGRGGGRAPRPAAPETHLAPARLSFSPPHPRGTAGGSL